MLFWIILTIVFHAIGDKPGWNIDYKVIMGTTNFGDYMTMICLGGLYINILLFVFNLLLPAYPLDGSTIVTNVLLMFNVPTITTAMIVSIVGLILSVLVFIYSILSFFTENQHPFSILLSIMSIWVIMTSYELYKMYENDTLSQHPLFGHVDNNHNEATERNYDDVLHDDV